MNNSQNATNQIVHSVVDTLEDHRDIWQPSPGIAAAVAELTQLQTNIDLLLRKQTLPTQGPTALKRAARLEMADFTLAASGMLVAFAKQGHPELATSAIVSRTLLLHRRNIDTLLQAERIEQLAKDNPDAIMRFALDAKFLEAFALSIDDFRELIGKRRRLLTVRVGATSALAAAFKRCNELLDMLDVLIVQCRSAHPVFVKEYEHARLDLLPGAPKPKPEPTTASSNQPLAA